MGRALVVAMALALGLAGAACPGKPPAAVPPDVAVIGSRVADTVAPSVSEGLADTSPTPADPPDSAPATVAAAAVDDVSGPAVGAGADARSGGGDAEVAAAEVAPSPPRVDAALCEAACDHALALTEAELPAGASPELREAMHDAMRYKCPKDCLKQGIYDSVQCVIKALTLLQLSACRW